MLENIQRPDVTRSCCTLPGTRVLNTEHNALLVVFTQKHQLPTAEEVHVWYPGSTHTLCKKVNSTLKKLQCTFCSMSTSILQKYKFSKGPFNTTFIPTAHHAFVQTQPLV